MRALFKSHNLIGDALYASVPLREWILKHRDWDVYLWTLPDHVAPLYQGMVRDLKKIEVVLSRPDLEFGFEFNFDVSTAFRLSDVKQQHISQSYAEMLGVEIKEYGPIFQPEINSFRLLDIGCPDGAVLISMFSASCASREGKPPTKMPSWETWKPLLKTISEEYPDKPIKMLGGPLDILPLGMEQFTNELHIERMHAIPLNELALIMRSASLLVTLDNGMAHLAATQQCPTFLMYPRCLAPYYICPWGNKNLTWVHIDPSTVNPDKLNEGLKYCIRKLKTKGKTGT